MYYYIQIKGCGLPQERKEKMSVNEMESKIAKMQEWEALAEEAKAEALAGV